MLSNMDAPQNPIGKTIKTRHTANVSTLVAVVEWYSYSYLDSWTHRHCMLGTQSHNYSVCWTFMLWIP